MTTRILIPTLVLLAAASVASAAEYDPLITNDGLIFGRVRRVSLPDVSVPTLIHSQIHREVPLTEQEKWRQENHDYRDCWIETGNVMRCPEDPPRARTQAK